MTAHPSALLGAAADEYHQPVLAAGLSCPDLPLDPTEHEVNLLVAYGDANPRTRPLAIKLLGSRGHALRIPPDWPERSTVQVQIDQCGYALPDADGNYLQPTEYPPPQPTATATATGNETPVATAGISGEEFWDILATARAQSKERQAQLQRVRAENAAYKRRKGIGTRKERGAKGLRAIARLPGAS